MLGVVARVFTGDVVTPMDRIHVKQNAPKGVRIVCGGVPRRALSCAQEHNTHTHTAAQRTNL